MKCCTGETTAAARDPQFTVVCFSPDTWEYELSHVIDIYADDFLHRSIVALTQWNDIPAKDKHEAMQLLLAFVNQMIDCVGPHSLKSSTQGVAQDNLSINYRMCQRAGTVVLVYMNFRECF
jgi:hypothetical protein